MQRFVYKYIMFFLFSIMWVQSEAQNSRLLWYKGKLLNDTSLELASGQRLTYSPYRGTVRITSQNAGMMTAIGNRLKNREQFKKEVIQILTNGPSGKKNIDLANQAASTIDEVDRKIEESIGGSDEWTLESSPEENTHNSKIVPIWVQNDFDDVVNYVITLKGKEKTEPDAPPSAYFDYCFPCDKERQAKYKTDTTSYRKQFFGDHSSMISKGFNVIRYFEHRRVKELPYDSAAAERMIGKMDQEINYLLNELTGRVAEAWRLYKKNAPQLPMLNEMLLASHRQFELLGKELPEGFPDLTEIGQEMIAGMSKYFDDALQKRDYPVLLNISWYIGLLRQTTLLFNEIPFSEKLLDFLAGNRFEMLVNAEAELGKDGKTIFAKMKGSNFYRAVPDKDCKLRWHLYEPSEKMMQFKLEKAEMNMGVPASYTGTMQWETPPADIQLGFCETPVRDTLTMQNFMPKGEESWIIDGRATPGSFVRSVFFSCFMDEKRIRTAAADKQQAEKLKKELMEEYQKAIAGNEQLMAKDPASMTEEDREKLRKVVAATQNIQSKMTTSAIANNLLFTERLQNNLKTIFENEVDGRVLFPGNTSIQKAKFKVQLVHVE